MQSKRIRIGVLGGGLVSQLHHLPNLLALRDLFELRVVADPAASVRGYLGERFGVSTVADIDDVLGAGVDAVLIATPDPSHVGLVATALRAGVHVFCEKPVAYAVEDVEELIALRDQTGVVVQIGYMKRFDPHYRALLELLEADRSGVVSLRAEMVDCDAPPYIRHQSVHRGDDVPEAMRAELASARDEQIRRAVGRPLAGSELRAYQYPLLAGVVHAVNASRGILDHVGATYGDVLEGRFWAEGFAVSGAVEVDGGRGVWEFSQLQVGPEYTRYHESYVLQTHAARYELELPSPYLHGIAAHLRVTTGDGLDSSTLSPLRGHADPFFEELRGFHAALLGDRRENTLEDAREDLRVLNLVARSALR